MRYHLIEFEDKAWVPTAVRNGGTDFLSFVFAKTRFYAPAANIIAGILKHQKEKRVIDLCSGGARHLEPVFRDLQESCPDLSVMFTDLYPNENGRKHYADKQHLSYHPDPFDALNIPDQTPGMLTMFTALHHFRPEQVRSLLQQAVRQKRNVAFFDGGNRHVLNILLILLFHPLAFFFLSPFIKPVSLKKLALTYIIPLIPGMTIWDGVISVMRLYKPEELLDLTRGFDDYEWKCGYVKNRLGMKILYFTGRPQSAAETV